MNINNSIVSWSIAIIIVVSAFYGLNHLIMSMQGLPLNIDLTPAQ